MEKVNLRDLWKISKTQNKALLGDSTSLADLEFMEEYLANYAKLDRQLVLEKGFFQPIWNLQYEEDTEDVLEQFQDDAAGFIWKNKDSYQRIFDVLTAEYEPLWNYDKTSVITDQESGTDAVTRNIGARHSEDNFAQRQDTNSYGAISHTDTFGQREDTNEYGQKQITDLYGAVSETDVVGQREDTDAFAQKQLTDVIGAVSNSDTIGARSDSVIHGAQSETDTIGAVSNTDIKGAKSGTTENEIAGFNAADYVDADKTTTNENAVTDTHTEATRTNGHSTTQYTDQTSVGAQTNSHTENSRTDTHTDAQHTDTHTQGQQTNTHEVLSKTDTHTDAQHTDTLTQGAQTNTHGELAHSDTLTQGAHKDEHDSSAAVDSDSTLYGHLNTHNERTTGNIGVMSTQNLINQELELRIAQKFYDILFNDIVKNLCSYYDEGYDCF